MVGICLIHATAHSSDRCWWLGNIASCFVVAFVFISAWYGLKFKWRKIVSLAGMAAWCAAVVVVVELFIEPNGHCTNFATIVKSFMNQYSSYWFLWCYIVLMMLTPMIDTALDACSNEKDAFKIVLPIVALVFGWNFIASEVSISLRTRLPAPIGFGSHTFLALVGIYAVGRSTRKWLTGFIPTGKKLAAVCIGLMAIVALDPRLGRYYSPLAVFVAACWVMAFKNVKIPVWAERVVGFVAPSLFAVYLLHVSNVGNQALIWLDDKCAFVGYGGAKSILVSMLIFVTCIAVDMPRRALAWGWHFMQRLKASREICR